MILCRCECGQLFSVEDDLAGSEAECMACHRVLTIPSQSDPDADNAAAEAGAEAEPPGSDVPPILETGGSRLRLRKAGGVGLENDTAEEQEGTTDLNEPFRPPAPKTKKGGLGRKLIRAVVALVILVLGYEFGFGPIAMSLLDKPTLVAVRNGESGGYEAVLGWRRISQEVPAGATVLFRVYVGWPESQTLTLRPLTAGAGPEQKLKLQLRPSHSILVNVNRKSALWEIDENAVKNRNVDAELRKLVQQIAANDMPTAGGTAANAVRNLVREAIKGQVTEECIDLDAYRVDEFAGVTSDAAQKQDKLLLTGLPMRRIVFGNGSASVTFSQMENLEEALELPAFTVSLLPAVTVNVPARQPLRILRTAHSLRLQIHLPNQVLKVRRGQFPGSWDYLATCKTGTAPGNGWRWQWTFNGAGELGGEKVQVTSVWDMKQMPTVRTDKLPKQ